MFCLSLVKKNDVQIYEKIFEHKDLQNTERPTNVAKELFNNNVKEKTDITFNVEERKSECFLVTFFVQCIIKQLWD